MSRETGIFLSILGSVDLPILLHLLVERFGH
uniref:Uncharacterized protein n=1 Tax=Anguilla anguilla TaxID=7936 RepID=A0A0E9T885_ANGAN